MVMFGRILNCERDLGTNEKVHSYMRRKKKAVGGAYLNERIEGIPARILKVLFGFEHDLVRPRLKRCGLRWRWGEEVQAPSVRVCHGRTEFDPGL